MYKKAFKDLVQNRGPKYGGERTSNPRQRYIGA